MGYEHNIFVSYRSLDDEWRTWVREKFRSVIMPYLRAEFGPAPGVFWDKDIETGTSWPEALRRALADSKILVALLSKQYFRSVWCVGEMAHMLARGDAHNLGTSQNPGLLVVPVIIHDGDDMPACVKAIQSKDIRDCVSLCATHESAIWEKLEGQVKELLPDILSAVRRAPPHDDRWGDQDWEEPRVEQLRKVLQISEPLGVDCPSLDGS